MLQRGEVSGREYEIVKAELQSEFADSAVSPNSEEKGDLVLQWYQRTWVWLAAAGIFIPLGIALTSASAFLGGIQSLVLQLAGGVSFAFFVLGFAYASFVAQHRLVRVLLRLVTILVLLLAMWAVWNFLAATRSEALKTGFTEGVDTFIRNAWLYFVGLYVLPISLGFWLRRGLPHHQAEKSRAILRREARQR